MNDRAFYPSLFPQRGAKSEAGSGALLRRDLGEAMPVKPFAPEEIDRELPALDKVEVRLLKKEPLAWRRRHIEVEDRSGAIQKINVGYSHPDAKDEVIICTLNRISGKKFILDSRDFKKMGAAPAPFSRLTLQSVGTVASSQRVPGKEFTVDVYPEEEESDPFARSGFFVVATTAVIQERIRRLAERMDHVYPEGAQEAWSDYVYAQFDLVLEEMIPFNEQRTTGRVRRARCPAWMRFVSADQKPYAHEHDPDAVWVPVPFVDEEGQADRTSFSAGRVGLANKEIGDTVYTFEPRKGLERVELAVQRIRARDAHEAARKASHELRRNTIPPYVRDVAYASEQPFLAAVGGGLTNDKIHVPKTRPKGVAEWNRHDAIRPLRAIEDQNWETMLKVAEGTYHRDLDRLDGVLRDKREVERRHAREKALKHKMVGECIDLKLLDQVTRVDTTFGERFLIEGIVGGEPTYIVDSPNAGVGLYVFHTFEDAQTWAQKKIDFIEARRIAKAFIVHDKGWEERIKAVLRGGEEDPSA